MTEPVEEGFNEDDTPEYIENDIDNIPIEPIWQEFYLGSYRIYRLENFSSFYKFIQHLGSGAQGKTELYSNNSKLYTIKFVTPTQDFLEEIKILSTVKNIPNVSKYVDHFLVKNKIAIVYEYIEGIDMSSYIDYLRKNNKIISIEELLGCALTLCNTLKNLHAINIAHRDIKPENIIYSNGEYFLIDFGLSCQTDACKLTGYGTPYYMAPEWLVSNGILDFLYERYKNDIYKYSDMWSLGVTLYNIMELTVPWEADNIDELREEIISSNGLILRYPYEQVHPIILKLMSKQLKLRPLASQAYDEFVKVASTLQLI